MIHGQNGICVKIYTQEKALLKGLFGKQTVLASKSISWTETYRTFKPFLKVTTQMIFWVLHLTVLQRIMYTDFGNKYSDNILFGYIRWLYFEPFMSKRNSPMGLTRRFFLIVSQGGQIKEQFRVWDLTFSSKGI